MKYPCGPVITDVRRPPRFKSKMALVLKGFYRDLRR